MKRLMLLLSAFTAIASAHAQECSNLGSIAYQRWNNISGAAVSNLTNNPAYPNSPSQTGTLTRLQLQSNWGNNFGARINGWLCPPATGNYTFWIASDASAELWLSTSSNASGKQRIAFNTSATNSQQWNRFASQKSVPISLTAGTKYYIEVLMKESSGADHLSVGWARPGQSTSSPSEIVPGSRLSTTANNDNVAPTAPAHLQASFVTNTSLQLNWTASTDNVGVAGYDVYRNGVKVNASNVTGTVYAFDNLTAGTNYNFFVQAKDAVGNVSVNSNNLSVSTLTATAPSESFSMRTVIAAQRMPHDLVYGPDNNIWYTERFGGAVSFVVPATGAKTTVLNLGSKMVRTGGQDGLMGLALHPQFQGAKPFVYIMYTYESSSATMRKMRIERYSFDSLTQQLTAPVTILENIPGSNDHNSARLAIGPDEKLYVTVGDMGAGQFDNASRPNNAQNLSVLEGKVLRLNTEAVSGSWIPADNPFIVGGQTSAVYSLGHRNAQGLVWGRVAGADVLYSTEHGPFSDDEVNMIQSGRNYGWPNAIGYCDGNYNGRTTGGFTVNDEQANCAALNVKEPLRSIFPSTNPPSGGDFFTWPSLGVSGTEFYGSTAIPGWQNSLLIATLKGGRLVRYQLSGDGSAIISDTISYFRGQGRFRDVVVSPDGLKIYVACDSSGSTSGPTGSVTSTPANPGSILEFAFNNYGQRMLGSMAANKVAERTESAIAERSVDVYPNPANQYLVVYHHGTDAQATAVLTDLNGRPVLQTALAQRATRLDISRIPAGMYVLRVHAANGKLISTKKVLVVR